MSIESDLYTVLSGVCARAFPDFAPTSTTRPYVTYQQIGGEVVNYLGREVPSKRNARFQVNVWADTRASATSTAQSIEDAIRLSTRFQASPESALTADFDADFPVYSARQDFNIWGDR